MREARIRAAEMFRNFVAKLAEPFYVDFVDNTLVELASRRLVLAQSKLSSMTTDFGTYAALSRSSRCKSSPPRGYGKTASFHSMSPLIDFAYGSINSFAGLQRCPSAGFHG